METEAKRITNLQNNIAFLTKENEVERLKNKNILAQKEIEIRQANFKLLIMLGTIFLVLVISFIVLLRLKKKNIQKERDLYKQYLSAKNKLLTDVAHELRTPLTGLKLQVEALRCNIEDDIPLSYQTLDNKLEDMNNLISDINILAHSDQGSLTLTLKDEILTNYLDNWQQEYKHLVEKNNLTWQYKNTLEKNFSLNCDIIKVKQLLNNVIHNSITYTNKPGNVSFSIYKNKGLVYLEIEDSTPSVPEDKLELIFDRLYRIEQSRSRVTGGSGLGLSICKSLVETQHGTISAEQSKFQGLKIIISFPSK